MKILAILGDVARCWRRNRQTVEIRIGQSTYPLAAKTDEHFWLLQRDGGWFAVVT
jgi:hypothetical protein